MTFKRIDKKLGGKRIETKACGIRESFFFNF